MERGKYRQYNTYTGKQNRIAHNPETRDSKIGNGKIMYRRVHDEKFKHYIGEKIILNRIIEPNEKERTVGGVVIGLYPHFILLNCGFYKTTVTYKDLVLGVRR